MPTHWSELKPNDKVSIQRGEIEKQGESRNLKEIHSIFHLSRYEMLFGLIVGILIAINLERLFIDVNLRASIPNLTLFSIYCLQLYYFIAGFIGVISLMRVVGYQFNRVPKLGLIRPIGYSSLIWPIFFVIPVPGLFITFVVFWPIVVLMSIIIYALGGELNN